MAEYWVEVQLEEEITGNAGIYPNTLPTAWFPYADSADNFAKALAKLPGVKGVGRGREGKPHSRKWGHYEPID